MAEPVDRTAAEERIAAVPDLAISVLLNALSAAAPALVAVLSEYIRAGVPAAKVVDEFLDGRHAIVITAGQSGFMPIVDGMVAVGDVEVMTFDEEAWVAPTVAAFEALRSDLTRGEE